MSVKGFKLDDGSIAKYDYNSLENITTDTTLSNSGVAADAKAVGDELSSLSDTVSTLSSTVGDATTLETTNKSSIVAAINEIEERVNGIGTYIAGTNVSGSVSVSSGAWTTISTMTLPAGTWIIIYGTEFTTNTTGERSVSVTSSSTAPTGTTRWTCRWNNASGGPSNKFRTMVQTNTEEQVYYLWATQNSGATLTAYPCFAAIRIKTPGVDGGSSSGGTIENIISELQEDIANLESSKLNYIGVVPSSGGTTAAISSTYGSVATVVQEVWNSLPISYTPFAVKIVATGGDLFCLGMRYGNTGQYGMLYFNHYYIGSGSVNVNNNVFTEHRTKPTIQTFVFNPTLSGAGWAKITLPDGSNMTYPTYKVLNCYTATTASGANIILNTTLYSADGTTTWWIKAINGNNLTTVASISISVEVAYIKV